MIGRIDLRGDEPDMIMAHRRDGYGIISLPATVRVFDQHGHTLDTGKYTTVNITLLPADIEVLKEKLDFLTPPIPRLQGRPAPPEAILHVNEDLDEPLKSS